MSWQHIHIKRRNYKISCCVFLKVAVDLPFEGRKVEGSWKKQKTEESSTDAKVE